MEATERELNIAEQSIAGRRAAMLLGGAALAGMALGSRAMAQSAMVTDTDILNFALNLEYLEAQFYTLATTGKTIDQVGIGITSGKRCAGRIGNGEGRRDGSVHDAASAAICGRGGAGGAEPCELSSRSPGHERGGDAECGPAEQL